MRDFFPESLGTYRLEIMWMMSHICKDRPCFFSCASGTDNLVLKEEVDSLWLL